MTVIDVRSEPEAPVRCAGASPSGRRCLWGALANEETCSKHRTRSRAPRIRALPARAQPPDPAVLLTAADSVVYYLGDPVSQLVKIGTTTKLRQRIKKIRMNRPRVLLLATEPGGYEVESQRHGEYQKLRVDLGTGEKEWFLRDPLLMAHVNATRHRYGILCPGWPIDFSVIARVRTS